MSLEARTRVSVQVELDLHTTSDRWKERVFKKNVVIVPLNAPLKRDAWHGNRFFYGFNRNGVWRYLE